ncbi:hypothetical protein A3A35_02515 [Candidatus Kaiserbacteria bacterium RIFCSPLOWO2_01_FULL_51_21]|uniref:Baseplate protein J-like domain-containing protein n=1 Tax=Candidatus Kaiserbacteria bacterium RIFCSPLOWO2_01_FULL_51_21 TaxID=1798508 RepID=A0A1F6EDS5_9BACT|nr:MAG: hypothetical protein A3A35_02515 [Candidatus Kaiserbacteria bacterium RIFCSPLOWO2_01_FULL_51_21]
MEEKNTLQDMVPNDRRSIRRVEITPLRRPRDVREPSPAMPPPPPPRVPSFGTEKKRRFPEKNLTIWILASVVVVGLGFALSIFFTKTTMVITLKESSPIIDTTFGAHKTPVAGELPFEVITLDKNGSLAVPATGEEEANVRASGQIIIYNNYGSQAQRLVRNTRFESSDKRIYRIDKSVVVPGKTASGPGSLEVTVYADEPGEKYNADLMDFTVPGFKGSPQYDKFYARSKTPMTGGFVGKRLTVDPAALEKARETIRTTIKDDLTASAVAQIPEDFGLFEGALFFDFISLPQTDAGGTVQIQEKGVLHGLLFSKSELARVIAAASSAAPAEGVPLFLGEGSSLTFTVGAADTYAPWEKESFSFTLKGTARLVASFNENALKQDLAGKTKSALPTVLAGYPGIDHAEVVMRPFWRQEFPTDPLDITLSTAAQAELKQ